MIRTSSRLGGVLGVVEVFMSPDCREWTAPP
jgi:hypothetical protein